MNYYERHLGDYTKNTAHLPMLEHGAYTLLLDWYYTNEKGIPADKAHRNARARTQEEKDAVDTVLNEFFKLVDGVWINERAEEEIEKYRKKMESARENGKKGGRPPKSDEEKTQTKPKRNPADNPTETQTKPSGKANHNPNETQQKAHQAPSTIPHTPKEKHKPLASTTSKDEKATPASVTAADLAKAMRASGIEAQSADPRIMALAEQGTSVETVVAACEEAKRSRPDERIGPVYIVRIVERWANEARGINVKGAKKPNGGNHGTRSAVIAGLTGSGESRSDDGRTIEGETRIIG